MEEKTQKERLEQELRFLKESFEAEVISKEEFEKGQERIALKLKELNHEGNQAAEKREDENEKSDDNGSGKEIEKKPEEEKTISSDESPEKKVLSAKNGNKIFKYAAVFLIVVLVAFFSYSVFKEKETTSSGQSFTPICSSDGDCMQIGMEGACLNPNTRDAKCEFEETASINILIVNDRRSCFNCDTRRVIAILQDWFGQINSREVDYSTEEGRELADKFDARLLPVYILDENITKKPIFEKSKQVFVDKNGIYLLSDDAAGSTFYIRRDSIPNKLDFFAILEDDASVKAEKNLMEFLDVFQNVNFEKHLPGDKITKELGIKNFPTFLVNNKVKFSGVIAAETIKENFCKMNNLPECNESLSKSLV